MSVQKWAVASHISLLLLSAADGAGAAPADPAEEGQPSERVVITATQRASSVEAVPASVSVLTTDRLAGAQIQNVKQLVSLAPAMGVINSIGESFGQLITVRGIATSGADIGLESAAGITLDGIPLSRPNLAIFDLQGIDRVEFLRGPQGTLFGKNTTSGVINVLTRRPSFTPYFEASATIGDRDQKELRLVAEGGLGATKLAARIDALYGTIDGYLFNPNTGERYGGRERKQVRGQVLFAPSSEFDIRVIADYFRHDGTVNSPVYRVVGATGSIITALTGLPLIASSDASNLAQIDNDAPRFEVNNSAGVTGEMNWQTSVGRVTALTSYRSSTLKRSYDVDNSPASIANDPRDGERFNTATVELRLQGVAGRLDYLFGIYAGREHITSRDSYSFGSDFEAYALALSGGAIPGYTGLPAGSNFPDGSGVEDVFRQRSTNFALFTHHVFALTDRLSLSAGIRYTHEIKSLDAEISTDNPGCSGALAVNGPTLGTVPAVLRGLICIPNLDPRYDGIYEDEREEGNWSGTGALAYRIFESWNTYLSYSRGYKAGGFQLDRSGMSALAPSLSQLSFSEETADSFEGGIKGFARDDSWRVSAAVFHTRFNDYQFSYFTGFYRRTSNVPELTTKGAELETSYRPLPPLELLFSGVYQEVIFGDSDFPSDLTKIQGTTAPIAPRWVLVGTVAYEVPLGNLNATGFGNVDVRWQSKANVGASATPSPNFVQEAYATVGARIGAQGINRNWKVELWARNLFNQRSWSLLNNTTLQLGSISGFVTDARSFGVTVTAGW